MKLVALLTALSLPVMAQAAFDSARAPSGKVLKILRITPSGEDVPAARQIVLEFDRPVVPVGRMARDPGEIPIAISPKLDCQWRWLNTDSLACQLGEKAAMAARDALPGAGAAEDRDREEIGLVFIASTPLATLGHAVTQAFVVPIVSIHEAGSLQVRLGRRLSTRFRSQDV